MNVAKACEKGKIFPVIWMMMKMFTKVEKRMILVILFRLRLMSMLQRNWWLAGEIRINNWQVRSEFAEKLSSVFYSYFLFLFFIFILIVIWWSADVTKIYNFWKIYCLQNYHEMNINNRMTNDELYLIINQWQIVKQIINLYMKDNK